MLGIDDLAEGIFAGTPLGTGLVVATAMLVVGRHTARPAAKQALKGYFAASAGVRNLKFRPSEPLEDLYAQTPSVPDADETPSPVAPAGRRRPTRRRDAEDRIETLSAEPEPAPRPRRRTRQTHASPEADAAFTTEQEASA